MNWLSAILRISFVMHLNFFLSIFCLTRSPCRRTGNASPFISGKILNLDLSRVDFLLWYLIRLFSLFVFFFFCGVLGSL